MSGFEVIDKLEEFNIPIDLARRSRSAAAGICALVRDDLVLYTSTAKPVNMNASSIVPVAIVATRKMVWRVVSENHNGFQD